MAEPAAMASPRVAPDEFRDVISHFASGVTVITGRAADGLPCGTTASAVCSLSLEPPMVLICMNVTSETGSVIGRTGRFAVNILTREQASLATQLAKKGARKLEDVDTAPGELGLPLLSGCLAHLECEVVEQVTGGTHTVFLGRVHSAGARHGAPLAYYRGRFGRLDLDDEPVPLEDADPIEDVIDARTMMRGAAAERVVGKVPEATLAALVDAGDREAALPVDEQFYEAFVELAGSAALARAHARLRVASRIALDRDASARADADRRELVRACVAGDRARAKAIIERHGAWERQLLTSGTGHRPAEGEA